MTDSNMQTTQGRSPAGRIGLIVAGAVSGVLALGVLAFGAGALWAHGEKNDEGYLTTDSERFAAGTHAVATDNLDVELDGVDWLVDSGDLGKVQLEVGSEGDERVFVGIARTKDVTSYLRGVDHTLVTDVDALPFEASYRRESGDRRPEAPAQESFWAASTQGRGTQTIDWLVDEGDWSVVVMNADGSRGVDADVSAGEQPAGGRPQPVPGRLALSGGHVLRHELVHAAVDVRGVRRLRRRVVSSRRDGRGRR